MSKETKKQPEKKMCKNCWGMKVLELANGDTIECPACKGKGYTE